jgi:hypothetical protein
MVVHVFGLDVPDLVLLHVAQHKQSHIPRDAYLFGQFGNDAAPGAFHARGLPFTLLTNSFDEKLDDRLGVYFIRPTGS